LEEIGYQVAHAIAGRTRIRIPWLETKAEAAGKLQRLIESLNFVTSVRINSLAQSIVILYKASAVSQAEAEAHFVQAIRQSSPEPPPPPSPTEASAASDPVAPAPGSEVKATPPPRAATATDSPSDPSVVADSPVAGRVPSPSPQKPLAEETPCPWDDPVEPQNGTIPSHSTDSVISAEVQEPEKPQAAGEDSTVAQTKQNVDQKKTASKRKAVRKPTGRSSGKPL
jgi:Heavy metal associated domain 2